MNHYDDPFADDIMRSVLFQSQDGDFYDEADEYFDDEEYLDDDSYYEDEDLFDESFFNEGDLDEFSY